MLKTKTLKTAMITAAVSCLLVTGAMAQSSQSARRDSTIWHPPAAKTTDAGKFISMQGADKWVFSKFKGTDVLGPTTPISATSPICCSTRTARLRGDRRCRRIPGHRRKMSRSKWVRSQVVPPEINSSTASRGDDPSNIKLKVSWTKDQLNQAATSSTQARCSNNRSARSGGTAGHDEHRSLRLLVPTVSLARRV